MSIISIIAVAIDCIILSRSGGFNIVRASDAAVIMLCVFNPAKLTQLYNLICSLTFKTNLPDCQFNNLHKMHGIENINASAIKINGTH